MFLVFEIINDLNYNNHQIILNQSIKVKYFKTFIREI